MTPENISNIRAANEAFTQADLKLEQIETGMDDVMDKLSRIEALTDRIKDLSLQAGSLMMNSLGGNIADSTTHTNEALEDLRAVGINPQNQATGPFFVSFHDGENARRRASLGSGRVAKELNTMPEMGVLKDQGAFVSFQSQRLDDELKAARLGIKGVIKAGNALCQEDSL